MNPALGTFSDTTVAAAVAVFLLTLIAFAAEWAFGSSGGVTRRTAAQNVRELQLPERAGLNGRGGSVAVRAQVESASAFTRTGGPGTAILARPAPPVSVNGDRTSEPDRRSAAAGSIGSMMLVLSVVLLGAGVVTRGIAAQRVPWGNLYEFSITGSFVVAGVHTVLRRRLGLQFLDVWVAGFAATCSGAAVLLFHEQVKPLFPQLRSTWLVIHVSAAVVSTGIFTVGAVLSGLYLFKARREAAGLATVGYATRLPSAARLDRLAYRLNAFGFPLYTLALIFGAVWAKAAYGRYWEWDPKETWMLISWVLYAAYLHARATAGWRGRVAATIALVAFATILFNLLGVNFLIAGKHSYA